MTSPPINHIEIVGGLVALHQRDRQQHAAVLPVPRMTRYSAQVQRLLLQVEEEDGLVYTLPLDVPTHLPDQQALLAILAPGDRIHVHGRVCTEATFDRRFATLDNPDGRPTSQLTVVVAQLRHAGADDVNGSWLQLMGRISVPPTIRRHERATTEEVGRTSLVVEWVEPSRRPGSHQQLVRIDRIPLDIPLAIDGSIKGLRAGNRILVEGRLEPFQRPLRPGTNGFVQHHLAALHAQWQAEATTLSATERGQRERHHLQQLRRLQSEQCVRVRAGYVELLDGQPMTVEDARTAHATFVAQQKQRTRHRTAVPERTAAPNEHSEQDGTPT
jgi:hypothetical protein